MGVDWRPKAATCAAGHHHVTTADFGALEAELKGAHLPRREYQNNASFHEDIVASARMAKTPFNFVPINTEEQVDCQSHDGIMMPDSRFLARRTLCSLLAFIEWERFETFCGSAEQDQAISATGQSLKTLAGLWEGARCTWVCEHHHVRFAAALALRRRHMSTHTHIAQHPGRLSQGMSCSGSHPSG